MKNLTQYQFELALQAGKTPYKCIKDGKIRYTLASSIEQCQQKFLTWHCEPTTNKVFKRNRVIRKLIEVRTKDLIVCDNPQCDFRVASKTGDPNEDCSMYLNEPCPKCGENLLTETDLRNYLNMLKPINFLNKWFSWLTYFIPDKKETTITRIHCHSGMIHIKEDK